MVYTLTISLLMEKPFYLLRPQSFSFQIVSEFIDIFVKFFKFYVSGVRLLTLCFVLKEGFLYTTIVQGGGDFLPPSSRVRQEIVLDVVDTCIIKKACPKSPNRRETMLN